ncbi:ABC transporter substrate-binding protein [Donghicola sp. C2-DW-16]|uniref:ABC transporter substrate-binding protein n=1 Tax=Donghicola mangrovi TaxID=2729614 RepID=A0ABX2PH29_9RHOB|nr:ABC transporter substrate-binding protein [Donghicola mangrovi]NVO28490.1 ABC transporter substrate-binding protein [Donghicola mangrovi]
MPAPLRSLWVAIALAFTGVASAQAVEVKAAVLRVDYQKILPISRFDLRPFDLGFAGAALADEDNSTTGRFLGHTYETQTFAVTADEAEAKARELVAGGMPYVVVVANGADTLKVADAVAEAGGITLNAAAHDNALRGTECRANLLHIAPSNDMNADAVAQFAMWKKWPRWVLIQGSNPADQELGQSYERAAKKFGAKIVDTRTFEDTGGTRRTDSGHVLVQRQLPTFMQGLSRHDVVIAADNTDYFAAYLPYHLWDPRPVMGSAGLRPVTFHAAHEAWGATQYHTRFEALTGRYVHEEDYNVWLALRVLGEAVTRTGGNDVQTIRDYILSDKFELAAFKGQKVTFRDWDGQMRQPILLFDDHITVSVSPQDGFLHQTSPLDTLGLDRAESPCHAFN